MESEHHTAWRSTHLWQPHSPVADPSASFAAMRNVMDRLFEQPFTRLPFRAGENLGNPTLSLDVIENGDTFVIKAAVPGVDPRYREFR